MPARDTPGMTRVDFDWPAPPGATHRPVWTGRGFMIGDRLVPVLSYEVGSSGWSDDLTAFHEESAGAAHFIDVASRRHAIEELDKHLNASGASPGAGPVILEVGCSSGFMLRELRERRPEAFIIGADYVRGPLEQLASDMPGVPLLQFDLVNCPLPSASIDAAILLNVLEHIEDDLAAARQIHRILKPGGVAIIEVPAGPRLYDVYDKLLMHFRRYSLGQLKRVVESAGFEIRTQSHLGFFIYPGFWLVKQRNKRFLSEQQAVQQKVVESNIRSTASSRLLARLMGLEARLGRRVSYPFGIRCLVTCVKVG